MKANRKCPVLPLLLTGIVAVFSLYGCSATRGVEKVSRHIEYDTAVTAEELHPNIDSLCPSAYQCICDTEKKLDYIIYYERWFMRYVIDWSKGIAKIYRYEDVRQTQLTDILFVCLNYPGLSTMLRTYYYDKDGNVTGMKDHLKGFRLCPRQALYIGNRYTRRCRSRKHPEAGVIRHQSTTFKRWRYFFRDRKGKRWMLIIDDATGKVISKEERPGKDIDEWMIRHGRFYN